MIIVRGVNVFPSQIEAVLMEIEGVEPHFQMVLSNRKGPLDEMEVQVEVEPAFFPDAMRRLRRVRAGTWKIGCRRSWACGPG